MARTTISAKKRELLNEMQAEKKSGITLGLSIALAAAFNLYIVEALPHYWGNIFITLLTFGFFFFGGLKILGHYENYREAKGKIKRIEREERRERRLERKTMKRQSVN